MSDTRAQSKPPESLDAWDLYQRGLTAYYQSTKESFESSIGLFDRVNELDPSFAPAFAMGTMARIRYMFHYQSTDIDVLVEQARAKAESAIALDARDPICLLAKGRVNVYLKQYHLGISQIEQAIAISPSYAMGYNSLGIALSRAGRPQEALSQFDQAIRLSPFDSLLAGSQIE